MHPDLYKKDTWQIEIDKKRLLQVKMNMERATPNVFGGSFFFKRKERLTLPSLPPLQTVSVRARRSGCNSPEEVARNTFFSTGGETILTRVFTSWSSPVATANKLIDWAFKLTAASATASDDENFPDVIRTTV